MTDPIRNAGQPCREGAMATKKPMNLKLKTGALHKALGVAKGTKIPKAKLQAAKNSSSPLMRKRANFALVAAKWAKK